LTGVVLYECAEPLASIVYLSGHAFTAYNDPQTGAFALENVPAGSYSLVVEPRSGSTTIAPITLSVVGGSVNNLGTISNVVCDHAPVADAGGPYQGAAGATIVLDGSAIASPGFTIVAYSWDLTGNFTYTDSTIAKPSYTVTGQVGQVATVCLKVMDSYGKSSPASCATVTTVP
jgi:hypothetical protein